MAVYPTAMEGLNALTRKIFLTVPRVERTALIGPEVRIRASTLVHDYRPRDSWVRQTRWNQLVRQYIDWPELHRLKALVTQEAGGRKHVRGASWFLPTPGVPFRPAGLGGRRWSSCILGWGFSTGETTHFTMVSRTSFLGYLAPLDLSLGMWVARQFLPIMELSPEEVTFSWTIMRPQFHNTRSLPWLFSSVGQRLHEKYPESPGALLVGKVFQRWKRMEEEGVKYGDIPYSIERRARMKYDREGQQLSPEEIESRCGPGKVCKVSPLRPFTPDSVWDWPVKEEA